MAVWIMAGNLLSFYLPPHHHTVAHTFSSEDICSCLLQAVEERGSVDFIRTVRSRLRENVRNRDEVARCENSDLTVAVLLVNLCS
jgi:hypothetical protein